MTAQVTIVAGPARSGKTTRLLGQYRQLLASGPPGCGLWLGPNARAVARIRGQLLNGELRTCALPQCFTFRQFGSRVLEALGVQERPLTELGKSRLLRQVIDDGLATHQLRYFAPVANTPGFLTVVAQTISQWKLLEIWPEDLHRGWQANATTPRQQELLWLYAEYHRRLQQHELFDSEGQFWLARTRLKQGLHQVFAHLQGVFVDGFADFTRTELDVLQTLSQAASQMMISLPLEPFDGEREMRKDVFEKPLRTFGELHDRFPQTKSVSLERRPSAFAALDFWETNLFRLTTAVAPKELTNFRVLQAAGEQAELEEIARRIKQLLQQREATPPQILVVFRSLTDRADLVRDIFDRHGLPVHVDAAEPLGKSAAVAALLAWLKLAVEDWPYRQLLVMLAHNSFSPAWPEWNGGRATSDAARLVREIQLPSGCQELLTRVTQVAEQSAQKRPESLAAKSAASGSALLARLAATLAHLPQRARGDQWAVALTAVANELGLHRLTIDHPRERAAWDTALAGLLDFDRLHNWLRGGQPAGVVQENDSSDNASGLLSGEDVVEYLQNAAQAESLSAATSEAGRVLITTANKARSLTADHVFLAGLDERSFPSPNFDGGLLEESQRKQLADSGLPFTSREQRSNEEMLLFYEVLTRAGKSLTLSYPGLDEKAQPLNCSPYLLEMARLAGPAWSACLHVEDQLEPIPTAEQVASPRDARIFGVARALDHDNQPLQAWRTSWARPGAAENLRHALIAQVSRRDSQAFGKFEGVFSHAATRKLLAERFGADRIWSASKLEEYAYCPYRYLLQRVLKIEPLADLALETDYLRRGSIIHAVLAHLHRRLNAEHGGAVSPAALPPEQFAAICEEELDQLLAAIPAEQPFVQALLSVERTILLDWLRHYQGQHADYDQLFVRTLNKSFLPSRFEFAFGPTRTGDDDEIAVAGDDASHSNPLRITDPQTGEVLQLAGRVDRVDVTQLDGQTLFNIIDYKSGTIRKVDDQQIAKGAALQLPLYALAVQQLLFDEATSMPWQAGYWQIKSRGYPPKSGYTFAQLDAATSQAVPTLNWENTRKELLQLIFGLVESMRQGEFPMACEDKDCTGRCDFRTVCRVAQVRSRGKTWQHARAGSDGASPNTPAVETAVANTAQAPASATKAPAKPRGKSTKRKGNS